MTLDVNTHNLISGATPLFVQVPMTPVGVVGLPSTPATPLSQLRSFAGDGSFSRNDHIPSVAITPLSPMGYNISMILPHIFVGGCCGIQYDLNSLMNMGISVLINCSGRRQALSPKSLPEYFTYLDFDIKDEPSEDLSYAIAMAIPVIREAELEGKKCLIYCNIGMSRSISLVLAHLILSERMSLVEAMDLVKEKRRIASPNTGFMAQLIKLEKIITQTSGNKDGYTTIDLSLYRKDRFGMTSTYAIDRTGLLSPTSPQRVQVESPAYSIDRAAMPLPTSFQRVPRNSLESPHLKQIPERNSYGMY